MAKLTIEIEENEFALYDMVAYLNGEKVISSGNYLTESVAIAEAYDYVQDYFNG